MVNAKMSLKMYSLALYLSKSFTVLVFQAKFVHQGYFAIINEKTHMVILNNIVLVELERMINSLEWIIQTQSLSNDQMTHFCGQLSYSMTTFGQILQCRLKNKMMIIHVVKLLTKLYTILDEFTRQVCDKLSGERF